ncbi:MAG: asparagine synthase (glutamine-hydrolyzing), partial [Planctomycetota bacterium]
MCGIVGVITREPVAASSLDAAAIACLGHRGPDGSGRWSDDHAGLGHARLAIIDLSEGGSQPMVSAGGRYVITFNGEIYNYVELAEELRGLGHRFESRCDTEVALAAFERWGPACVERFRGMFALAIWDTRERELFMARDRVGEKPLAVYRDGDRLVFASELKALIPLLPRSPELDPAAVDLYLHYQYWPEPWTPLEGVRRVPPAHTATLRVDDWRYEERRYWDLESCSPIGGDPAEAIRGALEESVRLTLRSDVPVGVALSGGIDSACVAALASAQYGGRLRAFSVGYPGRPPYDERAQARALAEKLGIEFEEVELDVDGFVDFFPELVRILDEPIADPA